MPLEFASATDVGRKRDHNEDALLVMPDHSLAVVCDGMGGHEAGEVASGIGVETVKRFFELAIDPRGDVAVPLRPEQGRGVEPALGRRAVGEPAHPRGGRRRRTRARESAGWAPPSWAAFAREARHGSGGWATRAGTSCAGASCTRPPPITRLLNEMIRTGRLSEDEIENFQHKNVITRALGMADQTEVDVSSWDLEAGDVCVVCCDGLTGMVSDDRIAEILARKPI